MSYPVTQCEPNGLRANARLGLESSHLESLCANPLACSLCLMLMLLLLLFRRPNPSLLLSLPRDLLDDSIS